MAYNESNSLDYLVDNTFAGAGISYYKEKGYEFIGYDEYGRALYSDPALRRSGDGGAGSYKIQGISGILNNSKAIDKEDSDRIQGLISKSADTSTLAKLNGAYRAKDFQTFQRIYEENYLKGEDGNYVWDTKGTRDSFLPKGPDLATRQEKYEEWSRARAVSAAFRAHSLYKNWDKLSNAQRGLGLASITLDTFRYIDGTGLADKPIFNPIKDANGKTIISGLNAGQIISLGAAGYNVYALAKNWEDMSNAARLTNGAKTVASTYNTLKNIGLIDYAGNWISTGSSAGTTPIVAGSTASGGAGGASAGAGGASAGAGGAGSEGAAASASSGGSLTGALVGAGMGADIGQQLGGDKGAAIGATAGGAVGYSAPITTGYLAAVYGGYQMIDATQGRGDANSRQQGVAGGMMAAGGYALAGGPYGWIVGAVLIAGGMALGSVKTGKDDEQNRRDEIRKVFRNVELTDTDHNIVMPDGTIANLGLDNVRDENLKGFKDESKLNPGGDLAHEKDLERVRSGGRQPFDVDYTSRSDIYTAFAGQTLTQLITMEDDKRTMQMGGQLGNAMLGSVGTGADFTFENFEHLSQNIRGTYAKMGIENQAQLMDYIGKLRDSGRIKAFDIMRMQQIADFAYSEDREGAYARANGLFNGAEKGRELAKERGVTQEEWDASQNEGAEAEIRRQQEAEGVVLDGEAEAPVQEAPAQKAPVQVDLTAEEIVSEDATLSSEEEEMEDEKV